MISSSKRKEPAGELTQVDKMSRQLVDLETSMARLEKAVAGSGAGRRDYAMGYVDKGTQLLLAMKYRELAARGELPRFEEVEFRNHSQNGEDGILWYIFSVIGAETRKCIEIGAGNGMECNSANLIINHNWLALLCDGSETNVETGREFFGNHPDTWSLPPSFQQKFISAENVNEFIDAYGFSGEVDLLSLDIDGVDYWVWKAIEAATPRVVILEINAIWGCEASVTVPYSPDFEAIKIYKDGVHVSYYCGASLPAFVKLGREKGYRLVGSNSYDFNVVFMRDDVGVDLFPEVTAESCFSHPAAQWGHAMGRPYLDDYEWQEV